MKLSFSRAVLCSLVVLLPSAFCQPPFSAFEFPQFRRRHRPVSRLSFPGFSRPPFPYIPPFERGFRRQAPFDEIGFPEPVFSRRRRVFPGFSRRFVEPRSEFRTFFPRGVRRTGPLSSTGMAFSTRQSPAFTFAADRFGSDSRRRTFSPVSTFRFGDTEPLRTVSARGNFGFDRRTRTFSPRSFGTGRAAQSTLPRTSIPGDSFPFGRRTRAFTRSRPAQIVDDTARLRSLPSLSPATDVFGLDNTLAGGMVTRRITSPIRIGKPQSNRMSPAMPNYPPADPFGSESPPLTRAASTDVRSTSPHRPVVTGRTSVGRPALGGPVVPGIPFRNGRPVLGQTEDGAVGMEVGMGGHGAFPVMGGVGAGEMFKDGGASLGLGNGLSGHEEIERTLRPSMAAQIARGPPTEGDVRRQRELVRQLNPGQGSTAGMSDRPAGMGDFGFSNRFGERAMPSGTSFRRGFR